MPVHRASSSSYLKINKDRKIKEILSVFKPGEELTCRQIMKRLHYYDPNKVRPAVNWALKDGHLWRSQVTVFDAETKREVTKYRLNTEGLKVPDYEQLELFKEDRNV